MRRRVLQGDIPASQMLNSLPGIDPARRDRLIEVLDIDPAWRMHLVSGALRCAALGLGCGCRTPAGRPEPLPGCLQGAGPQMLAGGSRARWAAAPAPTAAPRPLPVLPTRTADGQRRRVQIAMGLLKPFQVGGLAAFWRVCAAPAL